MCGPSPGRAWHDARPMPPRPQHPRTGPPRAPGTRTQLSAAAGAPDRARGAGLRRPAPGRRRRPAGPCAGCSTASASCRSTPSTCSRARTTCRSSPGSGPTTARCSTAARTTRRGELFEYWGHEASLLPVALQPLLRWRMERAHDGRLGRHAARSRASGPELVDATCSREVRERGPLAASELAGEERPKRDRPVVGLERRQARARVPVLERPGHRRRARRGFERLYDLPERVLPAEVLAAPTPPARTPSARCCGRRARAGRRDRARPARLLPAAGRRGQARVAELVEAGRAAAGHGRGLAPARPTCTRRRACRGGSTPRALLGPFDSLIWYRDRAPSGCSACATGSRSTCPRRKRVHGYYVLPFLLGDRLVARVDLKADRQAGVAARPGRARRAGRAARDARSGCAAELERDGRLARPRAGVDVVGRGDLAL